MWSNLAMTKFFLTFVAIFLLGFALGAVYWASKSSIEKLQSRVENSITNSEEIRYLLKEALAGGNLAFSGSCLLEMHRRSLQEKRLHIENAWMSEQAQNHYLSKIQTEVDLASELFEIYKAKSIQPITDCW